MSQPRRRRKKVEPHRGDCFDSECKERGGEKFHCITCESLRDAGKKKAGDVFVIQTCVIHRDKAIEKIKKHALVAHPVNILRATVAGLKGNL